MTYEVPYSFVPGTKAKAYEVNANFNDVIQKILDTNGRIDSSDAQITELTSGLSTANTNISQKANSSDIDGVWVSKLQKIFENKTFSVGNNTQTYSLSTYLPDDNNVYEVLVSGDGYTGSSNGASIMFGVGSSLVSQNSCILYKCITRTSSSAVSSGCSIIPIDATRNLYINAVIKVANSGSCYLTVLAYRKVR